MKKLLISIIDILILVLLVLSIAKGLTIGGIEILGISQIKERNDSLDSVIQDATKLASTDYKNKLAERDSALEELKEAKTEYEEQTLVSTEKDIKSASQVYFYDIDMLWTTIGNHAKREGVVIEIVVEDLKEYNITAEDSSDSLNPREKGYSCNLSFTAQGSYVGIEEFITDIEDDSELGFRIEEFKMLPSEAEDDNGNTGEVQATFRCTKIFIKGVSDSVTSTSSDNTNTTDTTDTTENNVVENTTTENNTEEENTNSENQDNTEQ